MSKEMNLDKLIEKHCYVCVDDSTDIHTSNESVRDLLFDFAQQILKLAAENACILRSDAPLCGCPECYADGVDKESILDTINQIK